MLNIKNTLDGFLKDIEIKGNTIQDASNLADIRSVGDKVEGQELYKIDILATNGLDVIDASYQEDKLTILSPVQLEKVGDVADRIICKDGVWGVEKNIKTYELNINSNFQYKTNAKNINYILCYGNIEKSIKRRELIICDKLRFVNCTNQNSLTEYNVIAVNPSVEYSDNIYITTEFANLDEFKVWIKDNPIKVKYDTIEPQFIPLPHSQQIKLRTFANKTNISFLTEIEGTIKAQVPKSIGATVNSHTEQIGNLSKELDRVKKLEESTVSTVTTESDFTTVTETSNGYFEDVKLEGKTLVNLGGAVENQNRDKWKKLKTYKSTIGKVYTSIIRNTGEVILDFKHSNLNELICSVKVGEIKSVVFTCKDSELGVINYTDGICGFEWVLLEGDHTQNPPSYFEGLMSACQDVEEVSVDSVNSDETQSNKKPLLYYNPTTEIWEKPILRQWDSIEKHSDGKYYYHKRSGEVVLNGRENWGDASSLFNLSTTNSYHIKVTDYIQKPKSVICDKFTSDITRNEDIQGIYHADTYIGSNRLVFRVYKNTHSNLDTFKQWLQTNPTTVVYQLAEEKVYECTNIDLITYENETNYIVSSGAIAPKSTLKVHNNISNVVKILQEKVSLLESNVKASQEVQDMMILESDLRILDIELALMEHMPIKLNLGENIMLRSATYFNFIKGHIVNETYSKDYLENVMNKYLATNRLTQEEYDELYKMLYPQNYDIELPIEE